MNERILSPKLLKLVQKAGPGYSLADPEWVKNFAKLIVEEYTEELRKLNDGESVVLPKNREHAEAMVRVGMSYLEQNK